MSDGSTAEVKQLTEDEQLAVLREAEQKARHAHRDWVHYDVSSAQKEDAIIKAMTTFADTARLIKSGEIKTADLHVDRNEPTGAAWITIEMPPTQTGFRERVTYSESSLRGRGIDASDITNDPTPKLQDNPPQS